MRWGLTSAAAVSSSASLVLFGLIGAWIFMGQIKVDVGSSLIRTSDSGNSFEMRTCPLQGTPVLKGPHEGTFGYAPGAFDKQVNDGLWPIVFIHIPKTGGESIEATLGLRKMHERLDERRDEIYNGTQRRKVMVLTVVRNPYERLWSWFKFCLHGWQGHHPAPWAVCYLADYLLLCHLEPGWEPAGGYTMGFVRSLCPRPPNNNFTYPYGRIVAKKNRAREAEFARNSAWMNAKRLAGSVALPSFSTFKGLVREVFGKWLKLITTEKYFLKDTFGGHIHQTYARYLTDPLTGSILSGLHVIRLESFQNDLERFCQEQRNCSCKVKRKNLSHNVTGTKRFWNLEIFPFLQNVSTWEVYSEESKMVVQERFGVDLVHWNYSFPEPSVL